MRRLTGWFLIFISHTISTVAHWLIHAGAWCLDHGDIMINCETCLERERES